MPSEVERIAGRLRFLSDQAQQYRRPVLEASQKLREAAGAVATLRFEQPEGPAIVPPAHLAARLNQAADRARDAVAPLTQTAELLRVFAARLSAGGASAGGASAGGASASPGGAPSGGASSGGSGGDDGRSVPSSAPVGSPSPSGVPRSDDRSEPGEMPSGTGSVGPSRYGRYPTTTAVRLSPGNPS
jgi:hypothetical protein